MKTLIRTLSLLALILFQPANSPAQDAPNLAANAANDPKTFEQLITPTTIIVAQFNMQQMKLPADLQKSLAENQAAQPLLAWLDSMKASLEPMSNDRIYMTVDIPATPTESPIRFFAKKPSGLDMTKLNETLAQFRFSPAVVKGDFLVTSPAGNIVEDDKNAITSDTLTAARPALREALATVNGMPMQILVMPPEYLWATYRDLMPQLPDQLGGTPTAIITEGMKWATIAIDPAKLKTKVTIQSNSKAAADALATELPKLVEVASAQFPEGSAKTTVQAILKLGKPAVNNDRIEIDFSNLNELNLASTAVAKMLSAIIDPLNTREKMNRFKQLALAVHNYIDVNKEFPPGKEARKADGTSNLSWRVHILPFIGEAKLYSEFKLDQPWDSEHNIALLAKMPVVFSGFPVKAFAPVNLRPGYTTFVAPVGEGTIFGGTKPVTFGDITDGTSNTIMFVEVKPDRAVPWTAPWDCNFNPANPTSDLAIGADGQFLMVLGDGAVQLLPSDLPKPTIVHLFQMNDGNVINF